MKYNFVMYDEKTNSYYRATKKSKRGHQFDGRYAVRVRGDFISGEMRQKTKQNPNKWIRLKI